MKTVVILTGLVALALAGTVPTQHNVQTKTVDADFVARQKRVLPLLQNINQVNTNADYYKIGLEYDIEANIDNYVNKKAVEEFLVLYRRGFMPKSHPFSVFHDELREEAIALFNLFIYAKDFETFYKTAAFARVHLNEGQFLYSFYIAIYKREDTKGIVLPALYEVNPSLYVNTDILYKIFRFKMQDGLINPNFAAQYGVVKENDYYVFYSNYSNYLTYGEEEQRLSYLTEDIGFNTYYNYIHIYMPFWLDGDKLGALKDRRGEIYYYLHQQLLARYYLERLGNGLGEIPEFSWEEPIKTGYVPFLVNYYPFIQRNDYYNIRIQDNAEDLQFLDSYEKTFLQYLERGHFKAYNQEVDLHNPRSMNFVGNFWQANADLYKKAQPRNYQYSYEIIARHLLSAASESVDRYSVIPSALEFYQTSLRDPVFYQLYNRILSYVLKYKEYLEPYSQDNLHYVGVKISDVNVGPLVTYFDYYDFDVSNGVYYSSEELKANKQQTLLVRQPRLNHKPFDVSITVKSDVDSNVVVKTFLGPKYDGNGYPINLEDNWMNFVELDWFTYNLTKGENTITRNSNDFFFYREDSVPASEIYRLVDQGKVPIAMSDKFGFIPNRLMLPNTKINLPFQIFVIVYPYEPLASEYQEYKAYFIDNKPLGYPFDRPVNELYFMQPNMYSEDVYINHQGEIFSYMYNVPGYVAHQNEVPKH